MKIIVVGNGGREHTLVWKLSQSPQVSKIFWCPGNPAAPVDSKVEVKNIRAEDIEDLAALASKEKVDLTVVGPEGPLVEGIADLFRDKKLKIFGPIKQGAQLEGSKAFSKRFFQKYQIPTGRAAIFSDFQEALDYAKVQKPPLVVKADGLAAGKGVIICASHKEVEKALDEIMNQKMFGDAGERVLIEECLHGLEVSVLAITDGRSYQLLATAQDHKRALDGDRGLNTGGMGTYSPAPILTPELERRVRAEIFDPTIEGLRAEGINYCGVLYAGLMITRDGPKILEYNCRFGDPETQVILPRLENDLAEVFMAACTQKLDRIQLRWKPEAAVCVIMAAGGYPGTYARGDTIEGLAEASDQPGALVFHAGTTLKEGNIVTNGGRVLGVTALGSTLSDAVKNSYRAVDCIKFRGSHYRKDIAAKASLEIQTIS
jgi:phosphoribosylamine---glycine ligase